MAIPNTVVHDVWQGNITILINMEPVQFRNWTDAQHTYFYFIYQHSTKIVTIIPEFPSGSSVGLLTVTSLLTCFLRMRRRRQD